MKGWRRQKKPPEGEADALLLERLVPKITIAHTEVPPLLSELCKLQTACGVSQVQQGNARWREA